MTIYNGVNPPNVEGTYLVDPFVTVYCEDEGVGGYEPGELVYSIYIRLSNQNSANNTIDYEHTSVSGNSDSKGEGAFISGSGNNFTAFLIQKEKAPTFIQKRLWLSQEPNQQVVSKIYNMPSLW